MLPGVEPNSLGLIPGKMLILLEFVVWWRNQVVCISLHALYHFPGSLTCCVSISSLLEKIEQETWRETGISFVTSVTRLMERLLDYRYLDQQGLALSVGSLSRHGTKFLQGRFLLTIKLHTCKPTHHCWVLSSHSRSSSHPCVLLPDSVLTFIQVATTLIPSITEMISPDSAKQILNARVIPEASLSQGVLNASSRPAGLENFIWEFWHISWWLMSKIPL